MKELSVTHAVVDTQHAEIAPSRNSNVAGSAANLPELEKIIAAGLRHFLAVGRALSVIKEHELFKPEFRTFREYCEKRWGFKKSYAHHLLSSVAVVDELPAHLSAIVANEGQARVLARYSPEERVAVLRHVQEAGGPVTAARLNEAVNEVIGSPGGSPRAHPHNTPGRVVDGRRSHQVEVRPDAVDRDPRAEACIRTALVAIQALWQSLEYVEPVASEFRDRIQELERELYAKVANSRSYREYRKRDHIENSHRQVQLGERGALSSKHAMA